MRFVLTLLYVIILIALLYLIGKRRNDLFSPVSVFILMQLISYPYGLFTKTSESLMIISDSLAIKIIFFNLLYTVTYLISSYIFNKIIPTRYNKSYRTPIASQWKILIIFSIGLFAKIYSFIRVGGLSIIFGNVSEAYANQSNGFGILLFLSKFMLLAILLETERVLKKRTLLNISTLSVMSFIYMGSYLAYSSRGPAFELIIIFVFIFHYCVKRIKLYKFFNYKFIALFFAIASVSMIVVNQRNINNDISSVKNPVIGIMDEYSYVGRDAFVYDHFNSSNYFNGKILYNIVTAFIPSSVFSNKPYTDDGLYIINSITGNEVDINDSFDKLTFKSGSIPFTNQGMGYANFGLFGVVLFAIGLAYFQMWIYKNWALSKSPIYICLYFYGIYIFGFTSLRITNFMMNYLILTVGAYVARWKIKLR